jgi:ubiquinone/menaquinone biosynthesis C-methylase UbiE
MNILVDNFENIKEAFSRQSVYFDKYEKENILLINMRKKIREHVLKYLKEEDKILELNAGTGLDAVFFAQKGVYVHATDISDGMLNQLKKKILLNNLRDKISSQKLSFANLDEIKNKKFDYIFSNFGGLNCLHDLKMVTKNLSSLLKPGGKVTFVVMPPVCPWEILLIFRGHFKTAFRRFNKSGTPANIEDKQFISFYHSPKKVIEAFDKNFKKIQLIGLNSLIPPPYMKKFPAKFPKIFNGLVYLDNKISNIFPFNSWADHFILTMQFVPKNSK